MITNIRLAQVRDAFDISSIHVRAWQKAYHGLLPQKYLDELSVTERQAMWAKELEKSQQHKNIFVLEVEKQVRGFIVFGNSKIGVSRKLGEIHAINIDPSYWRQNLGSLLLSYALHRLKEDGFHEVILWVLPTNNRAVRFYESRNWKNNGHVRSQELFGINVDEVCYWRSLPEEICYLY